MVLQMAKITLVLFLLCLVQFGVQGGWLEDLHNIEEEHHGLPPPPLPRERAAVPEWGTVQMNLDNFDVNNNQMWNMRYIFNGQHFQVGGPIFIMIGAEWTIDPGWLRSGLMYDIAKENKAFMFYTEHRYYGESRPTPDLSTKNLKYLTTRQALEDIAVFIRLLKANNPAFRNSKVIVFGGSYGGSMSTWMRLKYPDLVDGAVASSAPLLAKTDFFEYEEVVKISLEAADPGCSDIIANAVRKIEDILYSGPEGEDQIRNDFNLCSFVNLDDPYDVGYMFRSLAMIFSNIVQGARAGVVKQVCADLRSGDGDDYARFQRYIAKKRPNCAGNYNNYVKYYRKTDLTGNTRQWLYQTCNQFGYFQTSSSVNQPFGRKFPVDMNFKMCQDIFGDQFTREYTESRIKENNDNFGGLNPAMTRVISVHGKLDPWYPLGLSHSLNADTPVYIVPTTTHCADLSGPSASDSEEMKQAKLAEKQFVRAWLQ